MLKIYWKNSENKLAQMNADEYDDHVEAIKDVQQMLKDAGETFKKPMLALIQGGKK